MKKTLLAMLAIVMLLGLGIATAPSTHAADAKPVVTVAFSGYGELMADIETIGKLIGNPDMAKGMEAMITMMTQGKGVPGLDKKAPWGLVVQTDGGMEFPMFGFIPVSDLKGAMSMVPGAPAADGGVYEVPAGPQKVFASQRGSWAMIAREKADLENAPSDPAKLLGDLPKKYLVAVKIAVKNIPEVLRDQVLGQMEQGMRMGMQRNDGESDEQFALRTNMAQQSLEQMATVVKEADEVLLGLSLDRQTNKAHLDIEVTAKSGTNLAAQMAQMKPGKTDFAGLLLPDAAITANWAGTLTDDDVTRTKVQLQTFHASAAEEIKKQDLGEEETKLAEELLDDVFDVLEKTVEMKKSDGGLALKLDPSSVTLLGGIAVADSVKLEGAIKKLVEAAKKDEPDVAKMVKLDAETYQGVRFHTLSIPAPDPDVEMLFGKTLDVVVGAADKKVFIAAGRNAAKMLKQVIDKSKTDAGKVVPPMQMKITVSQIAKFVAAVAKEDQAKAAATMVAAMMEQSAGKDHIILTSKIIPNGVGIQLELEEGVLKAIGSASQMMGGGGGGMAMPPADDDSGF